MAARRVRSVMTGAPILYHIFREVDQDPLNPGACLPETTCRSRDVFPLNGPSRVLLSRIHRAEAISAVVIAAVTGLAIALSVGRGIRIDLASFATPVLVALAMILAAAHYRITE